MPAQLVSTENEEGGLAVILMGGERIAAMDCLGYGRSAQRYPKVGESFAPKFTCLFDEDESWLEIFEGNQENSLRLVPTGIWSYRAFGKIISVDGPDSEASVDCGACQIPAPIEISDPSQIGVFIAFNIERLSVWRA